MAKLANKIFIKKKVGKQNREMGWKSLPYNNRNH